MRRRELWLLSDPASTRVWQLRYSYAGPQLRLIAASILVDDPQEDPGGTEPCNRPRPMLIRITV